MTAHRATDLLSTRYDTPGNAPFTRLISQRAGALIAAVAFVLRLTPNAVTLMGTAIALTGCYAFAAANTQAALIVAALLWQIAFAFDCADGQLARATARQSQFGGWLDVACDHVRNAGMALAVLHILLRDPAIPTVWANAAALAYLAGASVYLHTASNAQVRSSSALHTAGFAELVRTTVRVLTDAPLLMLTLCILQPRPMLLAAFASAVGAFLCARAVLIARSRLARSQS